MRLIKVILQSNPFKFVGVNYNLCMYPLRKDGRPLISFHLYFFTILIKLPFSHITEKGHGSAVKSYGFVFVPFKAYHHIKLGFKTVRFFKCGRPF